MLTDIVDALDRRARLALGQTTSPAQVIAEAHAFLVFLRSEPRLAAALDDLCRSAAAEIAGFRKLDADSTTELQTIRQRFAAEFPEADDSLRPPPGPNQVDERYAWSLAYFDRVAAEKSSPGLSIVPDDKEDDTTSAKLLRIVRAKLNGQAEGSNAANEVGRLLWNAEARMTRARQEWMLFSRTSTSAAAIRLVGISEYLLPAPNLRGTDDSIFDLANSALAALGHPLRDLRAQVYGDKHTSNVVRDGEHVTLITGVVARVYEGIRAALGLARSHRVLVDRFRLRAEFYGAQHLRAIATSRRRAEDALADRLAQFLFDQGLNPLTRPLVGGLEPDLLDSTAAWTLYVEAKQYDSGKGRSTIVNGMKQVWDTLSRLQLYPRPIREAFYVVFRRSGPRYVLPDELRSEGVVVYPVLVDIAELRESGSRQRLQPVRIDASDLLPRG